MRTQPAGSCRLRASFPVCARRGALVQAARRPVKAGCARAYRTPRSRQQCWLPGSGRSCAGATIEESLCFAVRLTRAVTAPRASSVGVADASDVDAEDILAYNQRLLSWNPSLAIQAPHEIRPRKRKADPSPPL